MNCNIAELFGAVLGVDVPAGNGSEGGRVDVASWLTFCWWG